MTSIAATAAHVVGVRHNPDNAKFGNDASLQSVERQLLKLAGKCHARVEKLGLSMDFDDVLQEMRLSYVKAAQKWNPQGGSLFTTYCQTVCLNNFNQAIRKMERERVEHGLMFEGELARSDADSDFEPDVLGEAIAGSDSDRPDMRLDSEAALRESLVGMSFAAKRLVGALLQEERRLEVEVGPPSPKRLRDLANMVGVQGEELSRVKRELLTRFGVRWQ